MAKKIHHYEKSKIYLPKNVVPLNQCNVITDNVTDKQGNIHNKSFSDIVLAKEFIDENHK